MICVVQLQCYNRVEALQLVNFSSMGLLTVAQRTGLGNVCNAFYSETKIQEFKETGNPVLFHCNFPLSQLEWCKKHPSKQEVKSPYQKKHSLLVTFS